MSTRKVYFNGEFINEKDAKISIYDSALMFGDMVFEMTRSFNKEQFLLNEHIDRLFASASYVDIDIPMSKSELSKACNEVVKQNLQAFDKDDEHRLMINVTRGNLSIYENIDGAQNGVNIVISDFPLKWTVQSMGPLFEKGINAVITNQKIIPAYLLDPKVKSRSRLHYMMANIEVSRHKGSNNWALLTDPDGFIAEGTGSNFLIIKNNKLIGPEPRNILRGISLDYVIKIAKDLSIEYVEKNIEPYDVLFADEAFMTATPFCLLPVTSMHSKKIGNGRMGNYTRMILDEWSNRVGVEIDNQIISWYKESNNKLTPYSINKK